MLVAAIISIAGLMIAPLISERLNRPGDQQQQRQELAHLPDKDGAGGEQPAGTILTQPPKVSGGSGLPTGTRPKAKLVRITHVTRYEYDRPVTLNPHLVRLSPADTCRTPITDFEVTFFPEKSPLSRSEIDEFGNRVIRYIAKADTRRLEVRVELTADLTPVNPFDIGLDGYATEYPFSYAPGKAKDLERYMAVAPAGPHLRAFLADLPKTRMPTFDYITLVNKRVANTVEYEQREAQGTWQPEETLTKKRGACRDSAFLLVEIFRQKGLAARFVSGYLLGEKDKDEYSIDLHAWVEVYLPGAGWVGLDTTSGLWAAEGHIPLAYGLRPVDVPPVNGSYSAAGNVEVKFSFEMKATVLK